MGTTFRFLGVDDDSHLVVDWFRRLSSPPEETPVAKGLLLYFRGLGPLVPSSEGTAHADHGKSPVVNLVLPRRVRGVLWTAGEVHFLATPLRQTFRDLHTISQRFRAWLAANPLVFSRKTPRSREWDYYLEGSIRNYESDVFALPLAMEALRVGRYFIADDDTDEAIERLCRSLRLRGVEGAQDR